MTVLMSSTFVKGKTVREEFPFIIQMDQGGLILLAQLFALTNPERTIDDASRWLRGRKAL